MKDTVYPRLTNWPYHWSSIYTENTAAIEWEPSAENRAKGINRIVGMVNVKSLHYYFGDGSVREYD